jgi:hypothetical protein
MRDQRMDFAMMQRALILARAVIVSLLGGLWFASDAYATVIETFDPHPLPKHAIELSRDYDARYWNNRFCRKWTDGKNTCRRDLVVGDKNICAINESVKPPGPIYCIEHDPNLAWLFCSAIGDVCGAASVFSDNGKIGFASQGDECAFNKRQSLILSAQGVIRGNKQ